MIYPRATSIFALLAALLAGQVQDRTPVIRSTTRTVQISVVVQNHKGEPVMDLKKEDFVLQDKGKDQTIQYFTLEKYDPSPLPVTLPAGAYSNRIATNAQGQAAPLPNAVTVILIDVLNTRFTDRKFARQNIIKFLRQLQPGDRVAIYGLANGFSIIHDFTNDTGSLIRALDGQAARTDSAILDGSTTDANATGDAIMAGALADRDNAQAGAIARLIDQSDAQLTDFYKQQASMVTLDALRSIARHLAGIPGRKNLIWVTGGFSKFISLNYLTQNEDMLKTVQVLNNAGIAMYPVDARGLIGSLTPSMMPSGTSASNRPAGPSNNGGDRAARAAVQQTQSAMSDLADRTGGIAFLNNNDIAGSVRRAINDANVTYIVGYTPNHDEWNGTFREIKIKVNRAGVDVRYRKGYFATPDPAPNSAADNAARVAGLQEGLSSPLLNTRLGMMARVVQQPTAAAPHARLRLVMDAGDISFHQDERGNWIADLDLITVVRDAQGNNLNRVPHSLHIDVKQAQYDEYRKTGVGLSADIDAPAAAVRARLVVRDFATGAMGSVDLPLAVK